MLKFREAEKLESSSESTKQSSEPINNVFRHVVDESTISPIKSTDLSLYQCVINHIITKKKPLNTLVSSHNIMASLATKTTLVLSIATSLVASGGILSLTFFDIPVLASQPASRSLPSVRWIFSRGSHTFPQAAVVSSGGFAWLAYATIPAGIRLTEVLSGSSVARTQILGYIAASLLSLSIGPVTTFLMIPTNFRLIELNERLGGAKSSRSAELGDKGGRSAEESVYGKDQSGQFSDVSQFTDISGPSEKTGRESSAEEDAEVQQLLGKFGKLNALRGFLIGLGGIVGLATALA